MEKRLSFINLLGKVHWDQDDKFKEICTQLARACTSPQRSSSNPREQRLAPHIDYQAPQLHPGAHTLGSWIDGK